MILYHITPIRNLENVRRKGLSSGASKGLSEILSSRKDFLKDEKSSLYFVASLEDIGSLLEMVSIESKKPLRKFALLEVEIPFEANLEVEVGKTPFYKYYERVPAYNIRVLGTVKPGMYNQDYLDLAKHKLEMSSPVVTKKVLTGQRERWLKEMLEGIRGLKRIEIDYEREDLESYSPDEKVLKNTELNLLEIDITNLERALKALDTGSTESEWSSKVRPLKSRLENLDDTYEIPWSYY